MVPPHPRIQLNVLLGQDCALEQEENLLLKSPKLQRILKTSIKPKNGSYTPAGERQSKGKKDRKMKRQKGDYMKRSHDEKTARQNPPKP